MNTNEFLYLLRFQSKESMWANIGTLVSGAPCRPNDQQLTLHNTVFVNSTATTASVPLTIMLN